jgi:hypothetical protein
MDFTKTLKAVAEILLNLTDCHVGTQCWTLKALADILNCMAECPSAWYCLDAGRVECPTCPVRPFSGGEGEDLTISGLSSDDPEAEAGIVSGPWGK